MAWHTSTANIGIGRMTYELDRNIMLLMDSLRTATCIARVNEDYEYSSIFFHAFGHDRVSTVTVLGAGSLHIYDEYQHKVINHHMTLTALIFFLHRSCSFHLAVNSASTEHPEHPHRASGRVPATSPVIGYVSVRACPASPSGGMFGRHSARTEEPLSNMRHEQSLP